MPLRKKTRKLLERGLDVLSNKGSIPTGIAVISLARKKRGMFIFSNTHVVEDGTRVDKIVHYSTDCEVVRIFYIYFCVDTTNSGL